MQDIADELSVTLDYFSSRNKQPELQNLKVFEQNIIKKSRNLNLSGLTKLNEYLDDLTAIQRYINKQVVEK